MAHITARHERSHSILASIRSFFAFWSDFLQRHRTFERVYGELSALSDRELADIGISRSQIVHVAWDAANRA